MSGGMYNFNFDALNGINAHPVTQVSQHDYEQVDAADEPLVVAGSLPGWLYTGTQWTHAGPSQVASTPTGGFDSFGTGVNSIEAPFVLNPYTPAYPVQPVFNQFAVPVSTQYGGLDFDGTIESANRIAFANNANTFVTGTGFEVAYEPSLPAIGAGTGCSTAFDTNPARYIAEEQKTPDEFALLQPNAGFDATADQ
ncbi:hypothetical protein PG996_003429 [Apiospora saccharicola]|uniref:Uncharacterized protein n=1 Tax=Apiospora saccharicola TaxID=335842 RepID=A0ABR1W187_9PEZI